MTSTFRRVVLFGMLATFLAPIIAMGTSPADRVHGLAGPFQGAGAGGPSGGL